MPHVESMSPMERHEFDSVLRLLYGQPSVQRTFYQMILKPNAHPDTIRYVESVLAKAV